MHKGFEHVIREDAEMANKCIEICSVPVVIRYVQIKTILMYQDILPINMSKISHSKHWQGGRALKFFLLSLPLPSPSLPLLFYVGD
jgi:hypothetical protein